jgi:hypothetical protein
MQVIKFVTKDFKSPGIYEKLDYSKFGIPIEVEASPKEYGQCARGIHVVPVNENTDLENVLFTNTMILLEVEEEDIVYCENNGKMRVRKAIPIRQIKKSDEEWRCIKTLACKSPFYAYRYALHVDQKPTDETRTAACNDPYYAYMYAKYIDKKPTAETRTATCKSYLYAFYYAQYIDKKPTTETRISACVKPICAYEYARDIDKQPTNYTRTIACQDPLFAYLYAVDIDKKPTQETESAACQSPEYAQEYAQYVLDASLANR